MTAGAGSCVLTANWPGTSAFLPATLNQTTNASPAALTITANNAGKTYGATLTFAGTQFTATGLLNGDTVTSVTLTSAGAAATAVVGPYPIVPSAAVGTGLTNYAINYVNGTLTVGPAALTITANNLGKTYGQTLTFLGTEFTTAGLRNGDAVSSGTLTSAGGAATAAVGPYAIVPSAAVGTGLGNYTITYVNGTLTVGPVALTIMANNLGKTYGQTLTFLGTEFTATGLLNGNTVTSVTLTSAGAAASSVVGSYPITPSAAVGTGLANYAISYGNGTLTVTKATSTTTITSNLPNPSILGQIVTVRFAVAPQVSGTPTGNVTVTATTGETCTGGLAAGAGSCTLTFSTGGSRTLTATFGGDGSFLASASAPASQTVSGLSLSTFSLLFGNQLVGTTSAAQTVTLSNVGTTTITGISFAWSVNFSDSNNCGGSLAPGRSCRVNVRFAPTTTGVLTGTLTITDSDPTSPQIVRLTGTGVQPTAVLAPTSLSFTARRGTTSPAQTITLNNSGTAPLTINNISLGGANPNRFSQTNNCGASLAVGASCTISVRFSPNRAGGFSATLQVNDDAPGSPQTATLTGTGN